jgi:hypothetical protein
MMAVKDPATLLERILWPQFERLSGARTAYLDDVTDKVIREEVQGETGEADEVPEPKLPGDRATPVAGQVLTPLPRCPGVSLTPSAPMTHPGS